MTEQFTPIINKTELAPGVFVYKDVIPAYEQIIPYTEQVTSSGMVPWERKEIRGNAVDTLTFEYPTDFKDPNDHAVLFDERLSIVFGGFFGYVEKDYLASNDIKKDFVHDRMVLMKYGTDADFSVSREDSNDSVSVMYYLNDDYQGGAIHFPELDLTYEPKANEVLIFPTAPGFEYTIEKITDGTKYSVLTYLR